ncbi:MCE family protein [Kutzneria sp. 744]|uniref:MCE family protein n=1 Tax=Kutzneria sp. (strain 744) TaxID=345341 RepID=UPI0003EEDD00|nr:MCE family protein [Kutzneria sp. 744]EWM11142.1 virulence factor Mce family protein [Kutzneria sp. 744]
MRLRVQLAVFLVVALAGIVGLYRFLETPGYQISVQLSDSGGVFPNAEVSYRGVTVGRVNQLKLSSAGVQAVLTIDAAAPQIPASAKAVVANRSAVGEQYIDLEPQDDKGPYLSQGSVIPQERTTLPPSPDQVLSNLDALVKSVPADKLKVVVDELDKTFTGTGPDLQKLLDASSSLTTEAAKNLPQTKALLSDGKTVLETQNKDAAAITSFAQSLNKVAAQLKGSDADIRSLISAAPAAAQPVDDILRSSGRNLSVVLANLYTTTAITSSRTAGIEELLVAYPVITAFTPGLSPDGTGHLGLVLNFFNPFPCTKGYETTQERPANSTAPKAANAQAYCAEPPNSPIDVRGSQNVPRGNTPRLPGALGTTTTTPSPTNMAQLLGLSG